MNYREIRKDEVAIAHYDQWIKDNPDKADAMGKLSADLEVIVETIAVFHRMGLAPFIKDEAERSINQTLEKMEALGYKFLLKEE